MLLLRPKVKGKVSYFLAFLEHFQVLKLVITQCADWDNIFIKQFIESIWFTYLDYGLLSSTHVGHLSVHF